MPSILCYFICSFYFSVLFILMRKKMTQSQKNDLLGQWQFAREQRNPLLQRHPVLVPLVLFASAIVLAMASFFTDDLFPVLTLIGVPSALVCYLLAAVLGLCGVIVSITGLLELGDPQWNTNRGSTETCSCTVWTGR
jgi:hypothetical protein